jgi:hypothetical protein
MLFKTCFQERTSLLTCVDERRRFDSRKIDIEREIQYAQMKARGY